MVQSALVRVGSYWKPIAIVTAGALLVTGGVVAVAESRSKDAGREALADASRVLQSVNVKLGPNGDLTGIKGNVVGTTSADKAFSFSDDYQPDSTAKDLPVRVLTSYRTAKKSGTDLSELDGYDGRVDITVTVQNLTVKPQKVTYDVDGEQRSQSALVGVPLTVVASTALSDTKPSDVITGTAKKSGVTNGVLSQDQDGKTQVQWATILAPPQLASSTTMTLAVDAKDFKVPDFDLSVQPGLVTDPSVGALLSSAFNPGESSQMRLQQRTIALIAQLNTVLAKAGKSMATVRKTLGESSKTLGTKTVSDLQDSTESIASSVKGLKGSVNQLGGDITGSLNGTKSQTLSELQGLVTSVNGLLGNTNIQVPPAQLDVDGCATVVTAPKGADSVYGSLLQVVSLLNGYGAATTQCRDDVLRTIGNIVGPQVPDATQCATEEKKVSVTCSLFETKSTLSTYADGLRNAQNTAIAALTGLRTDALDYAIHGTPTEADDDGDTRNKDGLVDSIKNLQTVALAAGGQVDVSSLQNSFNAASANFGSVKMAIAGMHQSAVDGLAEAEDLRSKNNQVAIGICNSTSTDEQKKALTDIVGIDCNSQATGGTTMKSQIDSQVMRWDSLAKSTDLAAESPSGLEQALSTLESGLAGVQAQITALSTAGSADSINAAVGDLNAKAGAVQGNAEYFVGQAATVRNQIDSSFDAAINGLAGTADTTDDDLPTTIDEKVALVFQRGQNNQADLAKLFNLTSNGFTEAGKAIEQDGKKTITKQKSAFAAQKAASAKRISAAVAAGLSQVDKGINSSTRDMDAARTLLIGDLRNVLLDLGTRKVKGSGLLGAMATSAATTGSANYQVALASRTATAYSNVRQSDIVGLLVRQAQTDAAQRAQAELPAFGLDLPSSADHETVYSFHLDSSE